MTNPVLISVLFAITLATHAGAQPIDGLPQLKDHSFPVYYSAGHQQRAESIALRIEKAISYHQELLGFKPVVTLLVLNEADWQQYTTEPVVYGMPHYIEKAERLVVAAEDNAFWKSFLPPTDQLPENLRQSIQATYRGKDGQLTMQPFFDLLAIHELGHAFHMQGELTMQRNWMGELFSNILLHTYIAEKEPESLPALTIFPQMVIAAGTGGYPFTSLQDIQERYSEIARSYPRNYGWYQCRWHSAAAGIYDAGGKKVLRKLWNALKTKKEILNDGELVAYLRKKADKSIAGMVENWERDMVK
ncbi:MAG: hypothetical protein GC171_16735 [Terrimonas sp.]|nr:hypothetical protein [Terrimonas sp.]